MNDGMETLTSLDRFPAPWGKEIDLKAVAYESGLAMLRITIREGKRFTQLDLDAATALKLGQFLQVWAEQVKGEASTFD